MFCKKCGTQIKNGNFCPKCGTDNRPHNTGNLNPNLNLTNSTENIDIFNNSIRADNWNDSSFTKPTGMNKTPKNKWLIPGIILVIIAVIIIIAIVFIIETFTKHGSGNAESAINVLTSLNLSWQL